MNRSKWPLVRPGASRFSGFDLVVCALLSTSLLVLPAEAQTTQVNILGDDPTNGIFDPSVEYAATGGEGWLAYSAVFGSLTPWGPHVETHIAHSTDGGASWAFETVAASSTIDQLQNFDGTLIDGAWNAETPSLVYDPTDLGAEWKLFVHRIFRQSNNNFTTEQNLPTYSWIGMRSAPTPSGPWTTERALLSSGQFPVAPYDVVEVPINPLDPSLAGLVVYSEPGAFEADGTIYLSLTGLSTSGTDRILLLASSDHGNTWRFVSTLLSSADFVAIGFDSVEGSAIVEDQGRIFLLVTPEVAGVLHNGTVAIEFESLVLGQLERTSGTPDVHLQIPAQSGLPADRRGGQADFHEGNTAGGLIQPALQTDLYPQFFTFSNTGLGLVASPAVHGPAASLGGGGFLILLLGLASLRALPSLRR